MVGTTSVTNSPEAGFTHRDRRQSGHCCRTSPTTSTSAAEWYYSKGSYVAANWFTKHVTNFLTQTTTQNSLFGITDPYAGAAATKATAELHGGRQGRVGADDFCADAGGQSRAVDPSPVSREIRW